MTQNKVMKLWTAIVTAFMALCTALGFITTTAAAAVPQAGATRNSAAPMTVPTVSPGSPWTGPHSRALPPTMKQRIRAEAHGSSPSCRHRPPTDATDAADAIAAELAALYASEAPSEPDAPLRR
ncbi:DUF6344 domain-containing protein [Streptomyces sp. NBC_01136]|uniref:DUF6344 domain-containing protein n=1 Tax=unclassified Streptomyces TaxID=2593676 RepID=UPI003252459F|nr:DUF6344 domain-containing protein [Streptomyces sp. NBC_01136]